MLLHSGWDLILMTLFMRISILMIFMITYFHDDLNDAGVNDVNYDNAESFLTCASVGEARACPTSWPVRGS